MSAQTKTIPFSTRLLRLVCLNTLVALALGFFLFWSEAQSNQQTLRTQLTTALIHSTIYGLLFGLMMPAVAERLAALRQRRRWTGILIALGLIAATSSLMVQLCLLVSGFVSRERFWPEFGYKTAAVFVIALVIGLCVHTFEKIRDRVQATTLQLRTQELEKERALKLASEARLASLESRLHPHFLFNTLNSISALILEDPLLAEQMVQRLAALLRTSLDACEQNHVPLREELKLVTDYLEIERARFRERLSYSINVEPGLEALPVPPLTLQPLVENSVKYAVSPRTMGGVIRISARLRKTTLALEVWDDGPGFNNETIPCGHGIDNLRARLLALLGNGTELSVGSTEAGTSVTVYLPLNGAQIA
jgi:two-component system, LytTR family, sensor histidine kinase AlgZ